MYPAYVCARVCACVHVRDRAYTVTTLTVATIMLLVMTVAILPLIDVSVRAVARAACRWLLVVNLNSRFLY